MTTTFQSTFPAEADRLGSDVMPDDDTTKPADAPAPAHDPLAGPDAGAGRDSRLPPCALDSWCPHPAGHDGECPKTERLPYVRQPWDTKTPDPTGWGKGRTRKT